MKGQAQMLTLRTTHVLLVASSALLTLALASEEPINVMLAVALHFITGQLVGAAMVAEPQSTRPSRS